MFAIALLTLKRMREPAFFIFLGIGLVLAFIFSGLDPIAQQLSAESIFAQVVDANRSKSPLLSAAFVMFVISAFFGGFLGAAEIPRDISSDLILILLSKPIRKLSYMLGKYLGMLVICLVLYCSCKMRLGQISTSRMASMRGWTRRRVCQTIHQMSSGQ